MHAHSWRYLPAFLLVAAEMLLAHPVAAKHVVVRPDGTGDYPTLRSAVQATLTAYIADTILVEPGYYDEEVDLSPWFFRVIRGRAGAESTTVRSIVSLPEQDPGYWVPGGRAIGLRILEKVSLGNNSRVVLWEDCVFEKGFEARGYYVGRYPVRRCTFRGPSSFVGFGGDLAECRFEYAPVYLENGIGYIRPYRCTFTGSRAELVRAWPRDQSEIAFVECTFSDARTGVEIEPVAHNRQLMDFQDCRFERISGSAIEFRYESPEPPSYAGLTIDLDRNRFADVGRALLVASSIPIRLSSTDDTLAMIRENGFESSVRWARISGLRSTEVGGTTLLLTNQNRHSDRYGYWENAISIADARIEHGGAAGVLVRQLPGPDWDPQLVEVRSSDISFCAGAGLDLAGTAPMVSGCLLNGNGGPGLRILGEGSTPTCSLRSNTAVSNGGDGIRIDAVAPLLDVDVRFNLVTDNQGNGIAIEEEHTGGVIHNDAWRNQGAAFVGVPPGAPNLQLDPLYCLPSAGDFHLQSGSPCGPSGPFGPIGARKVACAAVAATVGEQLSTPALHPVPNPTRGGVSFQWQGVGSPDGISVFDPQGRLVWSERFPMASSSVLRWDGRDRNGRRASPGVYLVRWTSGSEHGGGRIVLLEP